MTRVVAVGIPLTGEKPALGNVDMGTEPEAVETPLLQVLSARGLESSQGLLVIIDGGQGLRAVVPVVQTDLSAPAPCGTQTTLPRLHAGPRGSEPIGGREHRGRPEEAGAVISAGSGCPRRPVLHSHARPGIHHCLGGKTGGHGGALDGHRLAKDRAAAPRMGKASDTCPVA